MRLKSKAELQAEEQARIRSKKRVWNTDLLAIVYCRQSTAEQTIKNKEARGGQQVDLIQMVINEYHWPQGNILPIDENSLDRFGNRLDKPKAASGRLDASRRAGLRTAQELISSGKVGAVVVRDVSRLFRDPGQINAAVFADLCKKFSVVIITQDDIYDFNSKYHDLDDFLEEARDAAGYLEILHKTWHRGRDRKAKRGEYHGGPLPVGFMLDATKSNFLPLAGWAEVVKWLTHRFRQLDASIADLYREIRGKPIFPPLPDGFDLSLIGGRVQLRQVDGGYTITRYALVDILTHPANIGHMVYRGVIVRENAHPAIVDTEDFAYAIDHLGKVDLSGDDIAREPRAVRFTQKDTAERLGLLSGTRENGQPTVVSSQGRVYISQETDQAYYVIRDANNLKSSQRVSSILLRVIDDALERKLAIILDELRVSSEAEQSLNADPSKGATAVLNHVDAMKNKLMIAIQNVEKTLAGIEREIKRRERDYEAAADVMDKEDIRQHFEALARLRARWSEVDKTRQHDAKVAADIEKVQVKIQTAQDQWSSFDLDQRRSFLRLLTVSISMDMVSGHFMRLTIEWTPLLTGEYVQEIGLFWRERGNSGMWEPSEDEKLREMYPEASRADVLQALPSRSWYTIKMRASIKGIKRVTREPRTDQWIDERLSQEDRCVMCQYGIKEEWINHEYTEYWGTGKHEGIKSHTFVRYFCCRWSRCLYETGTASR